MAKKPTLTDLTSLANTTSAINSINGNNTAIENAFDNTLSLDGSTPNAMGADLDMNGNQILNLPTPTVDTDAVTKAYGDANYGGAAVVAAQAAAADAAADAVLTAADVVSTAADVVSTAADVVSTAADVVTTGNNVTAAQAAQTAAEAALDSFDDRYLGAKASDPTLDNDGNALATGALYFNSGTGTMRAYDGASWANINAGATVSDADYGDITVASGVWTIDSAVVSAAKLASNAVETDKINNSAVTTVKINDAAVTTAKLIDDAVTPDKVDTSVNAIGSIGGGTQDIDLDDGRSVSGTVDTSTTTFTFSNPKATGNEDGFVLYLTNGGSQTVNWPASVDWVAATAPTLTAAGVDVLVFSTINGGTIWNGFVVGLDVS